MSHFFPTTNGTLRIVLWGRPVKPLAVGVLLALAGVSLQAVALFTTGVALITPTDDDTVIGLMAFGSLVLILTSWFKLSQRLYELGLLAATGTFMARAVMSALVDEYHLHWIMPLSIAVLTGGAYILERADPHTGKLR